MAKNRVQSTENEQLSVCVLMGGTSEEREVSLSSGNNVFEALRSTSGSRYRPEKMVLDHPDDLVPGLSEYDLILNCLHGGIGEDGTLQSLFEFLGLPYTGPGPLACAMAMDKISTKRAFQEASLRIPRWFSTRDHSLKDLRKRAPEKLGFPLVVKPINQGSSIGVRIVRSAKEFSQAAATIKEKHGDCLVEEYIEGKEVTAGVLEIEEKPHPLPLIELRVHQEPFYNYKAKYTPGETEFIIPAQIAADQEEATKEAAVKAHQALCCRGYSRVDFRIDVQGKPYALELNALPGMTETSDLPKAAEEAGITYTRLIHHMLESAEVRRKYFREGGRYL